MPGFSKLPAAVSASLILIFAALPTLAQAPTAWKVFGAAVAKAADTRGNAPAVQSSAPPVANGTEAADTTGLAPAHAPAKVAIGIEIMRNLRVTSLIVEGAKRGVSSTDFFVGLSTDKKAHFLDLVTQEIKARQEITYREMAEANVDRFSIDQLNNILALSKIKYAQDIVLSAAGLATPDPSSMTPSEQTLFNTVGNEAYVSDFFSNMNAEPIGAEVRIAVGNAFTRFQNGQ